MIKEKTTWGHVDILMGRDVIKKWQPLNDYGYSFILPLILLFIDLLIELFTELFIDLSID